MIALSIGIAAAIAVAQAQPAASPAAEQLGAYELAYPFPAPDGRKLAFQGNFEGRWQLYEVALADGAIRRLHSSDKDDTQPAFSPDGSKLAFISNRDGNDEVYVLDLRTGAARPVSPHPGKDGHPKWNADGAWLVFNRTFDPADRAGDGDSAILRVRPEGSGLQTISDSPNIETFPSYSPDGMSVAFVEWFPDSAGRPARNGDIVAVKIATGERRRVTNSPEFDGYPYWGRGGDWIYFSSAADGPAGREAVVYRVRPDGSRRQRITELDGSSEVRAMPNADESVLFFNRSAEKRTLLFSMPISPRTAPAAEAQ